MNTTGALTDPRWPAQSWFQRPRSLSLVVLACAIAAVITELTLMLLVGERPAGYVSIVLSATGLLVVVRHRWLSIALTTAGAVISALFATEYIGVWTVVVFSIFLCALQARHAVPAALVAALALYLALVYRAGGDFGAPSALVAPTFCIAAVAAGSAVRLQAEFWEAARRRAQEIEASQAVELRRAVSDERRRIARDLHDVMGHELAIVNINVGVAEVSIPSKPAQARRALHSAREGLQRTLRETQYILELLHDAPDAPNGRAEMPSLEHVPTLVARMSAAGAPVRAHVEGDLPELDATVSAAAYRIVQEALTNAGKHGTGPADLTIRAAGAGLTIEVRNPYLSGRPRPVPDRRGYGLVGMRERAHAAGGTIEISHSENTFTVRVELPARGGSA